MQLGAADRAAVDEADQRPADVERRLPMRQVEQLGQRFGLAMRVVRFQLKLGKREDVRMIQQVVEPVTRGVELDPIAGARGDERAPAAVFLHTEIQLFGACERCSEIVLVERDADMVDARHVPLTRLHNDVDGTTLELGQAQLEADAVELAPRDARLVARVLLAHAPVTRDELEAELRQIPRLDLADPARHQVVMKKLHEAGDSRLVAVIHWTFEPLQVIPLLLLAAVYAKRILSLRARGAAPPSWRVGLFALGVALLVAALVSPIDFYAERSFGLHMIQHILLGDLAPLALLGGLTGPVLRPLLRFVHPLRRIFHPFAALALWILGLYIWHLPFLYDAALRHDSVHALEHVSFFTGGILMWAPVLETIPMPEWFGTGAKLGYVAIVRVVTTVLGNVFVWPNTVFYKFYESAARPFGLSAIDDQRLAGSVMMIEGSLVTIIALAWLFLRLAAEGELRQRLLESGLDARAVRRAVRYGRAQELEQAR